MYHMYRSQEVFIIWSLLLPIHMKGGPKVIFSHVYVIQTLLKIIHPAHVKSYLVTVCSTLR